MSKIEELSDLIERYSDGDGAHATAIPRLFLHRASSPSLPLHTVYEPAVCFMAQGSKQAMAGDPSSPTGRVTTWSCRSTCRSSARSWRRRRDRPFLCVRLDLDPALIGALMLESDVERAEREPPGSSLAVSAMNDDLLDAAIRLLRLLGSPRDIPILGPLAEREILYRLLRGEQTSRMSQIAFAESKLQQVNRAIGWIKRNFRAPLRIDTVASEARMSASALHQHFKTVTGMSPLQYQKQLRLQEARRLMLSEAADAAIAGHSVGYESPSQFSREYRRLFGAPPLRDIERLRESAGAFVAA